MNPSEDSNTCSIILLAAPASNQGKTTLTAAITRYYRNQGLRVIVFKAGPDFLDPMIHEAASGQAVYSLDTWMVGETDCQRLLAQAAKHADIIFIECGMGLFDGSPSSADLARLFNVPILLIVDASSMAQTFGAIVYGLTHYQEDLQFLGVIANRVASERHQSLLQQSLKPEMKLIASIPRDQSFSLPSRHLGLVQAEEIHHLDQQLDQMGQILHEIDFDLPRPDIQFEAVHSVSLSKLLNGVRIAIAKDLAFKFIYPANLDCLNELGAELLFFSPLNDKTLPDADAIWIPGGYPELFMQQLSANTSMKDSIKAHYDMNKPLLAECGGMLYLLEQLVDKEENCANMLGIIPGTARMQKKLVSLGLQSLSIEDQEIRGHTFHHSKLDSDWQADYFCQRQKSDRPGEAVYLQQGLFASYLHLYFPSNPTLVAKIFLGEC